MALSPYSNYFGNYSYAGNYQAPVQPTADERIWVQNETSANDYLVAPNGFVRLWDSTKAVFYEKRADANGRPMEMEIYSYTRVSKPQEGNMDFKEEIENLKERLTALEAKKGGRNAKSDAITETV